MYTRLSIEQVLGQYILLILLCISHTGNILLHLICVAMGFMFRISWFWNIFERQLQFRLKLSSYWVMKFLFKVIYGRTPR